jgi:FtsP/CotA-like multicopper oxidase with cupredoxin domain
MNPMTINGRRAAKILFTGAITVLTLFVAAAQAAVPGITGTSFHLTASADRSSQPDGNSLYSWGYGCTNTSTVSFVPFNGTCPEMQLPGPTLIVNEGQTISVTLTNKLPAAAGNTSIVFPGFKVSTSGGVPGLFTREAASAGTVTYTFSTTGKAGTHAYYSGTQPELQIEMGLFGAIIVLPSAPATCTSNIPSGHTKFGLAVSAYSHADSCYDREYLFQFSEMSSKIHEQVEAQVAANSGPLNIDIEPYRPNYYLVNGRSMPDVMDTNYSPGYAHQPYNGNPHMHPGDLLLMRVIGQGRWQHPFHFHGNHARVLARDGNLLLGKNNSLAGPLLFTIPTVSGQTVDAIFTWTGQGLNWDVYGLTNGHTCNGLTAASAGFDPTTKEYCPDHGKPIPVTPPDPNIVANGLWYGGTPYLGMQGNNLTPLPPGQTRQNPDAGYAYMWHSHNEREITTNDVFPGGMMMMLVIDPPSKSIDEKL